MKNYQKLQKQIGVAKIDSVGPLSSSEQAPQPAPQPAPVKRAAKQPQSEDGPMEGILQFLGLLCFLGAFILVVTVLIGSSETMLLVPALTCFASGIVFLVLAGISERVKKILEKLEKFEVAAAQPAQETPPERAVKADTVLPGSFQEPLVWEIPHLVGRKGE